jgi:hypothetical protein
MTRLPKPLFEWKPEMLNEGIYTLQAHNYRISIERAKEIYEVTAMKFAEQIKALFTEDYLKDHKDALVVASTCIESFAHYDAKKDTKPTTYEMLMMYTDSFGYPQMLTEHETTFRDIAAEMKKIVSGQRAKYELSYLTHITKCLCMNFMSRGTL